MRIARQNLAMRMSMRRFTRPINAVSRNAENHAHNFAVHFMRFNYWRNHQTLRVAPVMEAGLSESVWEVEDLLKLID
ncbi:MAG: hypothetical protein ABSB74_02170 [Tepidisphaeraceae bacterium]